MTAEEWRPIPGYEGFYEVSNRGRARSLDRLDIAGHRWPGRDLTQSVGSSGYPHVKLRRDGVSQSALVHRLVLLAFVGPAPEGMEALHADGRRGSNHLENLSWGTHSANMLDRVRHGNHPEAAKTHCKRGHQFNQVNTYVNPSGHRKCHTCQRAHEHAYRVRKAVLRSTVTATPKEIS